jgi:hypothetical protein
MLEAALFLVAFDLVAKPGRGLLALHNSPTNQASIRCSFERRVRKPSSRLDF